MKATRPIRLQLSRRSGFNLKSASRKANDLPVVKVDRSTRWGNPFSAHTKDVRFRCDDVDQAVEYYRRFVIAMRMDLRPLRGKNLACWCKLPKRGEPDVCHAAELLELANR